VENAIKHGIGGRDKAGVIWVRGEANRQSDEVVITIRDNGAGLPVNHATELRLGVGLGATKERLMRMYDRQSLEIHPLPEGGTEVRIMLPAHSSVRDTAPTTAVEERVSEHLSGNVSGSVSGRTPVHHA
jgi:two-component system, LytTR family, sensor kinase